MDQMLRFLDRDEVPEFRGFAILPLRIGSVCGSKTLNTFEVAPPTVRDFSDRTRGAIDEARRIPSHGSETGEHRAWLGRLAVPVHIWPVLLSGQLDGPTAFRQPALYGRVLRRSAGARRSSLVVVAAASDTRFNLLIALVSAGVSVYAAELP